jgi:predicted dehydrogenase
MASVHRVLVIGVGSIGERHLRCFKNTGRAEVSLVEVNAELRKTIADRYQVKRAFADLDAALAEPPDVTVVCTPAHLHIPMTQKLVEAGSHVLIEKPLSTSLDGIDKLRQTIAGKKAVVGVAYVYRAMPELTAIREFLHSGQFGKPVQVLSFSGQHFPTYRPAYRTIYYNNRATGGGGIQDAMTHIVNAAEWLVGPVDRLVVDAAHQVLEGVAVEDTVHLLARHGNVLASYNLNQYQAPGELTFTINCERGTIRWETHEHRWRWMEKPDSAWHDEVSPPRERDVVFVAQANAFLDAVEGKKPVLCTLDEGLQTLKVNLAALASWDEGRWQAII